MATVSSLVIGEATAVEASEIWPSISDTHNQKLFLRFPTAVHVVLPFTLREDYAQSAISIDRPWCRTE